MPQSHHHPPTAGDYAPAPRCQLLVIGYGNEMRGDDAAGPMVAREIAACGFDRIQALPVPLLLPDLALDMAEADKVVFVDASLRCPGGRIRLSPVVGTSKRPTLAWPYSPAVISALFEFLHSRRSRSWLLEIPALEFEFGEHLSAPTAAAIQSAVRLICRWSHVLATRRPEHASILS